MKRYMAERMSTSSGTCETEFGLYDLKTTGISAGKQVAVFEDHELALKVARMLNEDLENG